MTPDIRSTASTKRPAMTPLSNTNTETDMTGFKTFLYGLAIAGLALLSNEEMAAFFAKHIEWVGTLTGTGIIILRALTTNAIFNRGAK